ncbi:MAG: hypothetical protein HY282_00335 [Nitrospirae bacterium]|nr:hypothetical protein [Candidatus Manganitrophaceae bacterium]
MKTGRFFWAMSVLLLLAFPASAEKRESVFYLPGEYNFATRRVYPEFNALLNIIDIGHADLAERLIQAKSEAEAIQSIEGDLFRDVTKMFLGQKRRPRFSPSEETIAPESVKLAWRVNKAFDWTHYLHRQVYDIFSDDRVSEKDRAIRGALNYYLTEPKRTFPLDIKSMRLMEGQSFSGYWKEKYPKFNGAIWAYHWLQLAANEALLEPDPKVRRRKMETAVDEFKKMFLDPARLPKHMPMAHEISPTFADRFPEIAATFDNLHSFHDIYMDILTNPAVRNKREEAVRQLHLMQAPIENLETMPLHPLPPIPIEQQQALLQMNPEEAMAMMMMSTEAQLAFLKMSPEERRERLDYINRQDQQDQIDKRRDTDGAEHGMQGHPGM